MHESRKPETAKKNQYDLFQIFALSGFRDWFLILLVTLRVLAVQVVSRLFRALIRLTAFAFFGISGFRDWFLILLAALRVLAVYRFWRYALGAMPVVCLKTREKW